MKIFLIYMSKFNEFNYIYLQVINMLIRGYYCYFNIGLLKESFLFVVVVIFCLGLYGLIKVYILMY